MTTTQAESNHWGKAFIDGALTSFRANKGWADKAVAQLPDDKLHLALDPNTNCIAVIMKHVAGNLASRWTDFLTTDGEKPWRNRDDEFVDTFRSRAELLECWERGWACLDKVRGLGTQWIGTEGALEAAKKDWMERVRYDHGESFIDMTNAKDFESRCGRVSIGEVVGQVTYRCEILARPCKPPMKETAQTSK